MIQQQPLIQQPVIQQQPMTQEPNLPDFPTSPRLDDRIISHLLHREVLKKSSATEVTWESWNAIPSQIVDLRRELLNDPRSQPFLTDWSVDAFIQEIHSAGAVLFNFPIVGFTEKQPAMLKCDFIELSFQNEVS
eukprot:c12128_g1_i1.p1 GENE.c12128_g1_i1~~c12128_g1_i1.p1  ORF type:complete len:134 (-),score=32.80 c12128_g1_i1:142-543(-)